MAKGEFAQGGFSCGHPDRRPDTPSTVVCGNKVRRRRMKAHLITCERTEQAENEKLALEVSN